METKSEIEITIERGFKTIAIIALTTVIIQLIIVTSKINFNF